VTRSLIFTPDRNTGDRRDFTGAFAPEASAFAKLYKSGPVIRINVEAPLRDRTDHVIAAINAGGPIDLLAFFCHGFPEGLQLVGDRAIRARSGSVLVEARADTTRRLAEAIAKHARPELRVALYACSAGAGAVLDGNEGFADRLRDALCAAGVTRCTVYAHTTAGHATQNPHVRMFAGDGSPVGGTGGSWIVAPGSKLWPAWRRALRTDLRFRFPLLTLAQIHTELASGT
jgi:hypothetical protein